MGLMPHKEGLGQECSEVPRLKGGCKTMTFHVLIWDKAKWNFHRWENPGILEPSPVAHLKVL